MTQRPFLLGLTGSIGMGKSTTAAFFEDAGCPVWDADAAVARLYAPGGKAVSEIGAVFPDAIENASVNRDRLKAILKDDPAAITQLERLVHPLVKEDREAFIQQHADQDILVFDIPLLFETSAENTFDAVVVVTTARQTQMDRLLARGTMDQKMIEMILARQMPDAEKREKADYIIRTDTLEDARAQVHSVIQAIRRS